jgi:ribose 5-phosphate isomerase B
MKIAIGSDEKNYLTDALIADLQRRGHEVLPIGPLAGAGDAWPEVGRAVGEAVAAGAADQGVVCCYTGTGVSIAANKVPGVRAALVWEPWIAEGARRWNDANVLVMSLKRTSPETAREIVAAWLAVEAPDEDERENIAKLS